MPRRKGSGPSRSVGRPRIDPTIESRVVDLRLSGVGIKAIAKRLGIGVGTVQRVERERKAATAAALTDFESEGW